MNKIYPYSSPVILSDTVFSNYGQDPLKGTSGQRKAAFIIAEKFVWSDIDTFLKPTNVTGTFHYIGQHSVLLDYAYVNQVHWVRFIDTEENIYWTITGTDNVYVQIRDDIYGIVDLDWVVANCGGCHTHSPSPYQIEIAYNAGLQTGTSMQPDHLLALATYADIILNEIVGHGNEAPGDARIDQFSNQSYSEVRRLKNTTFGGSPRANFVSKLFQDLRVHRYVGI